MFSYKSGILKKIAEFAEEFAKFTPGIRRARARAPGPGPGPGPMGPGPWARAMGPRYRWGLGTGGDSVPVGTAPTPRLCPDEFTDILRIHGNPMNSQKYYEFTEIL